MSLGKKIISSYIVIWVLLAGIAASNFYGLNQLKKETDAIVQDFVPLGDATQAILTALIYEESGVRGYLVTGAEDYLDAYNAGREQVQQQLAIIDSLNINNPQIVQLIESVKPQIVAIEVYYESMVTLGKDGHLELARLKVGEGKVLFDTYLEINSAIEQEVENMNQQALQNFENAALQSRIVIVAVSVVALIATLGMAYMFVKQISLPVQNVSKVLQSVANGDLSIEEVKVKNKDEIGVLVQSVNKMVKDLRGIMSQISDTSTQLAASSEELTASAEQSSKVSEQIASTTEQVASGAEEQLSSVRNSATTVNQMSVGIQQVAMSSDEVAKMAEQALEISKQGIGSVHDVIDQMREIQGTVQETSAMIYGLGERSKQIGNIVQLITDIANQTNLLALNAAIEAARAGESGRGFAVVADEVRKLAEQSSESAQQISDLIAHIQRETDQAIASMTEGTDKVANGVEKTEQVGSSFEVIDQAVTHVAEKISEVASSIEQIAEGSQHIVQSIEVISKVAQESASAAQENAAASEEQLATMEEIASSAQTLSVLAEDMQTLVSRFKL
ncbi:methyl-accepting chemotaxis protein [Brevibacillus sp. TJ4]|uniref:methyl-accepting chemotaxis protein n=1 Tax=Brevibacillus sp. TJ4 TaxID=3234853 RepID=UPI003BA289E4